jgi:hypothetical protein
LRPRVSGGVVDDGWAITINSGSSFQEAYRCKGA